MEGAKGYSTFDVPPDIQEASSGLVAATANPQNDCQGVVGTTTAESALLSRTPSSFLNKAKHANEAVIAYCNSGSHFAQYALQYTGFIYLFMRTVSLFLLVQVVIFFGFMLFGTALNFMVSFAFVLVTNDKRIIFAAGLLFLMPYIMTVYFWFSVQLVEAELVQLITVSKQRPITKRCGILDCISGIFAWVFFIALVVMFLKLLVIGDKADMVLLMVCTIGLVMCFAGIFHSFLCYSKSLFTVVGAVILAMIISVSQRHLLIWLNEICYYFFWCSCGILLAYFFINSFPCHTYTLLKTVFTGKVTERDFGVSLFTKPTKLYRVLECGTNVVYTIASIAFFLCIWHFFSDKEWGQYNLTFYFVLASVWLYHMFMMWFARAFVYARTGGRVGFKWIPDKDDVHENHCKASLPSRESSSLNHSGEPIPSSSSIVLSAHERGNAESGKIAKHSRSMNRITDIDDDDVNPFVSSDPQSSVKDKLCRLAQFHFQSTRKGNYVFSACVVYTITVLVIVSIAFIFATSAETHLSPANKTTALQRINKMGIIESIGKDRVSICANDSFGFSWLDYAYISRISYAHSSLNIDLIQKRFTDRGFSISMHNQTLHYSALHHNATNLTVVSFRGTSSAMDVIHDVKILIESTIPKLASPFITLPVQTKDWITEDFAYTGSRAWPGGALALVDNGKSVVRELVRMYGTERVVVTGHSLGGALANIIGTYFNLTNYCVSPPGSEFSRTLYHLSSSQITKYVHSLVPQRDPVTALGSLQGTVVHIPCREPSSLKCHGLDATICMVSYICGDNDLADSCAPYWNQWNDYPEEL